MEFTKVEIERFSGYSYISKHIYEDQKLSLKAKGLLSLLFSLPDDWSYSESGLAAINADGVASVRSAIKELKDKKYLTVERERATSGRLGKSVFHFYQIPYDTDRNNIKTSFTSLFTETADTNIKIEDIPVSIMSNYHLRDNSLTLKAKGLLSLMFSLPPTWPFSEKNLAQLSSDGLSSIRSAVQELKEKKYLEIKQQRNAKGYLGKSEYYFYRAPYNIDRNDGLPECDFPHTDNPKMEKPLQENQNVEKSSVENKPVIKTINNKNSNNKYSGNKNNIHHHHIENKEAKNKDIQKESVDIEMMTMKIRDDIGYEGIKKYNLLLDNQLSTEDLSQDTYDKYYVNFKYLDALIAVMAELYCSTEPVVQISNSAVCSRKSLIDKFEVFNQPDIKNIVKNIGEAQPRNTRRYILTVINNYF